MNHVYRRIITLVLGLFSVTAFAFTPSGLLEIHYINVGTAGCTFVIGPDGTTLLMDGGNNGDGYGDIIPYFQSIGLTISDDLDYMLAGHLDSDHIGGLDEVIYGGYDVTGAVYYNGSPESNSYIQDFYTAAGSTTAGGPDVIALNTVIDLGDGAIARCVMVNGYVLGDGYVSPGTENCRSIAMLITYGEFEYIFASDLSGRNNDEWCTDRHTATNYSDDETPLSNSLVSPSGANLLGPNGLEVMHVNHHGSESSTNSDYMNNLKPSVACISVGWAQPNGWDFPRHDILDNVLLGEAPGGCVSAAPAMVFQTEEGSGTPGTNRSYRGYAVGDIIIKTNGQMLFQVDGTGRVHGGPTELSAAGLPRYFPLDEDTGDPTAPSAITDLAATGGPESDEITLNWTATGGDAGSGTAAVYDIRYRLAAYGPINSETAWGLATQIENEPDPQIAGTAEGFVINDLVEGQSYYFAIKVMDDNINLSSLSNSPQATAGDVLLLLNGDMELWEDNGSAGPPDYWSVGTSSITASRETGIVHGDGYSANLTWTDTAQANCEFISSVIPVTEGETYTCSLYVYDNDIAGYVALYFKWNTNNTWGPSTYGEDSPDWRLLTYSEPVPSGATTLQVVFRCYDIIASWDGSAAAYIDDITLNEGPIGDQPPEFGAIYYYPYPVVYPENTVAIRAEIFDDGVIVKDSLYYQMSTLLDYTAVGHDSIGASNPNYYWYTIPASSEGTLVQYYVMAQDDISHRVESSVLNYNVSGHPENDLVNGDFELWTVYGAGGPPDSWARNTTGFTAAREASTVHGGNYSCNLTWTSTQTQILDSDPINVTPGQVYPCSAYVYDNDPAGRFRICFLSDGGNSYPENYSSDQTSWQHLAYAWAAPAGATYVIVQFRLYDVSTAWDGNATVYADDVVFSDTSSGPQQVTIHDIQFNNSQQGSECYDSPYLNQVIPVTGTVVGIQQGTYPDYFLQDCSSPLWNGVFVFDDTQTLQLGQNITITAQVDEYSGLTELKNVSAFASNSMGNAICTTLVTSDDIPPACNAGSEAYEGMLVRLNNVTCVAGPDGYGAGYLKSPGATDSCGFDDDLHYYGTDHPVDFIEGHTYDYVIGIVHYTYDEYKIHPRFASDVMEAAPQAPEITNVTRYPAGIIRPDDVVLVSAEITDDGTITKDSLYIETISLVFSPVARDSVSGNVHWYTIGANDSGTTVNYYVVAVDNQDIRTQSSLNSYEVEGPQTGYAYLPGDVNMAAGIWPPVTTGPDVTYLVNFFRSLPSNVACRLDGFWASADANGDCNVIGSDVTKLINYFRRIGSLSHCSYYPPLWPVPGDIPTEAPAGWPNCDEIVVTGDPVLLKTGKQ